MSTFTCLLVLVLVAHTICVDKHFQRFIGIDNLQIGYSDDCHLYWRGDSGWRKNGEFRCNPRNGDPMKIVAVGSGYKIFSGNKALVWNGNSGNTKNAEFRVGASGDVFWIRRQSDGLYTIGFSNCPLFWKGQKGNTKNAEFRCGSSATDSFWIKGDSCAVVKVDAKPAGNTASIDGEEIVGIVTGASCYKGDKSLTLSETQAVTEEVSIEMSENSEINWSASTSVSVTAGANIFGAKTEVQVTAGFSVGGSRSFGSSKGRSTSTETSKGSGYTTNFKTPGGSIIVGFVTRYKFDKSNVPATVTVSCKGGYKYQYDSHIKLKSTSYGHTHYQSFTGKYKPGKCTKDLTNCLHRGRYLTYKQVAEATEAIKRCFPADATEMFH